MLANHFDGASSFDCEPGARAGGILHLVMSAGARSAITRTAAAYARGDSRNRRPQGEQSRLEQLANYDELTGHFNKTACARRSIRSSPQHARQSGGFLSIGIEA